MFYNPSFSIILLRASRISRLADAHGIQLAMSSVPFLALLLSDLEKLEVICLHSEHW